MQPKCALLSQEGSTIETAVEIVRGVVPEPHSLRMHAPSPHRKERQFAGILRFRIRLKDWILFPAILAPNFRATETRMTLRLLRNFVLSFGLLLLMAFPFLAHHSFAAEYDASKPVTLKGVIAKVEWTNPHIRFYVDVKSPGGSTTRWEFSGPSVNTLARNGAKKDSLKIGETVTVDGFLARNVKNLANMKTVKSVDGKILLDRIGDQQ